MSNEPKGDNGVVSGELKGKLSKNSYQMPINEAPSRTDRQTRPTLEQLKDKN